MSCPTDDTLRSLLQEPLVTAVPSEVVAHLVSCTSCRDRIRSWGEIAKFDAICKPLGAGPDVIPVNSQRVDLQDGEKTNSAPAEEETATYHPPQNRRIGNYELLKKIGRGGGGEVYAARHTLLQRRVAIKILAAKHAGDSHAKQRFFREMETIGSLNHPHIVQAFDAGEADGVLYLTMELIDGPDVESLARLNSPFPIADACEIVRQAAVGIQYAHERHLVHRDIKPSNLLLSSSGVKVADLGMVLWRNPKSEDESLTGSCVVMGTADYLAPEQSEGAHYVDIRADIYSLGCTLYRLLAGTPPYAGFGGRSLMQKLMAHVQQPIPDISLIRSDVDSNLKWVLSQLLAKDPKDRFAEPRDVALALAQFCSGADLKRLITTESHTSDSNERDEKVTSPTAYVLPPTAILGTSEIDPGNRRLWFSRNLIIIILGLCSLLVIAYTQVDWAGKRWDADKNRQVKSVAEVSDQAAIGNGVVAPKHSDSRVLGQMAQRWQTVFGIVPTEELWPGRGGLGTFKLDDDLRALVIQTEKTFRFVKLGELKKGSREKLTIKVDCHSQSLAGQFGFFLGFQPPTDDRNRYTRFQGIEVTAVSSSTRSALVSRYLGIVDGSTGFIEYHRNRDLKHHENLLDRQDWTFEIEFDRTALRSVKLCDQHCHYLCEKSINEQYSEIDFTGAFGLYSHDGTTCFRNPEFQLIPNSPWIP